MAGAKLLTWGKAVALAVLAVLVPVKPLVLGALALIFLDAVVGCWAAMRRGEKLTSAGFRRTVSKTLVYTLAIIAGHVTGVYMLRGLVPVASLVSGAIGVVEIKSVLESGSEIVGVDLFRAVIDRIGSKNAEPTQEKVSVSPRA
jgi:hypothetical protein